MKMPFILFFIKGPFPSEKDIVEKNTIKDAKVVFRNALAVPPEAHSLEICDGVAGSVPEIYAKKFPKAEVAIKKHAESLKALSQKVGDVKAPKANPNPNPSTPTLPGATSPATPPAPGRPPAWNPNPATPPA